jgi:hypothetical protein
MGSFSDWLENSLLDHAFKGTSMSQPTSLFIALCLSTIEEDDTGATLPSEVSGGAYVRTECSTWDAASAGATENSQVVTFPEATAVWGTITDFAIVDSGTAAQGNCFGFGKVTTSKRIATGDTAKFATGDIDITLN